MLGFPILSLSPRAAVVVFRQAFRGQLRVLSGILMLLTKLQLRIMLLSMFATTGEIFYQVQLLMQMVHRRRIVEKLVCRCAGHIRQGHVPLLSLFGVLLVENVLVFPHSLGLLNSELLTLLVPAPFVDLGFGKPSPQSD